MGGRTRIGPWRGPLSLAKEAEPSRRWQARSPSHLAPPERLLRRAAARNDIRDMASYKATGLSKNVPTPFLILVRQSLQNLQQAAIITLM